MWKFTEHGRAGRRGGGGQIAQQGGINVFRHKTRYNLKRNCYKQTSETKHSVIFQKFRILRYLFVSVTN